MDMPPDQKAGPVIPESMHGTSGQSDVGLRGGRRTRNEHVSRKPGLPLVSVVMPVLNGGERFVEAVDSVLTQTYENVELIVLDGGSTDGTLDVLRARDPLIDVWTSGRDGGVYFAMNKGIDFARGDFVAILNADDSYLPDTVERAVAALRAGKADYAYSAVAIRDETGRPRFLAQPLADPEAEARSPSGRMPFPHITMIVARRVYRELGPYDTRFRIAADYEFALRLLSSDAVGTRVPGTFGWVTSGGMSDSVANLREKRAIIREAGVGVLQSSAFFASSVTKRWVSAMLPDAALDRILKLRGTRVQGYAAS